ncbi:amidase signature enzyme [Wilcoxina mikolae CBS 423.85]|nr:amidase signature enzyme [Wilcoxina mikolae CBS 423.85]
MFAAGVDPCNWTDYECPYNPRGDGMQSPSGSSSGSAVAVAAYDWCDFAVGTDTGGSTRAPGGVNGVFANRFSTGVVSGNGVWCVAELLDAIGVFTRSPQLLVTVSNSLLPPSLLRKRWKLLFPDDPRFHWGLGRAGEILEAGVKGVENVLGCQRTTFTLENLWAKENGGSLDHAVGGVYSILSETGTLSSLEFSSFLATKPPMDAIIRRRHEWARELSPAVVAEALKRKMVFQRWVNMSLFGNDDDEEAVLVFPQTLGVPTSREEKREKVVWDGFSIYAFGYAAACAEVVLPIGEVDELPVCLSLVARNGADRALLRLLEMAKCVVGPVKAGRWMY